MAWVRQGVRVWYSLVLHSSALTTYICVIQIVMDHLDIPRRIVDLAVAMKKKNQQVAII
jgi:hypothetical protein